MPYSSDNGKAFTDRCISRITRLTSTGHKKILDIGAGSGTYSDRYTPLWLSRKKFHWTAVEIWEPYVEKFGLRDKYDDVKVMGAHEFFKQNDERFDICFMGDVIEHMTKEEALSLIDEALKVCTNVIISIPIIHYPQDEYEGNPYEKHVKDDWSVEECLASFKAPQEIVWAREGEIGICILTTDPQTVLELGAKVGVYAICKNEELFVHRFYNSIKPADAIVICDTGSTDTTFERLANCTQARAIGRGFRVEKKKVLKKIVEVTAGDMSVYKICVTPWRFDDARNTALSLLPFDLDLCVSLDLDEMLDDNFINVLKEKIIEELHDHGRVLGRYNHRFRTVWNWIDVDQKNAEPNVSEHWHERVHPRGGYLWKLPVHEVLVKQWGTEDIKWLNDAWMIQKPDTTKNRSSYKDLLEISLKEDPSRWKSWFFYVNEILYPATEESIARSLEILEKTKKMPGADVAYLSLRASQIMMMKRDFPRAEVELLTAMSLAPNVREYRVALARLQHALGKDEIARITLRSAKEITQPTSGYEYDPNCWNAEFDNFCKELGE